MRMRGNFFPALVVAIVMGMFGLSPAHADFTLYNGMNTFQVRVTNSSFKPIYDARGSLFVNGTWATIQVEAAGYRRGQVSVSTNANIHNYYCDVRLDDPSVQANVRDANGGYVSGAYTNTFSQNMYWADEYGVRAYLPKTGYEQLTERKIEARVNYMYAFAPRIYLSNGGSRWNLEVVIKRRDLRDTFNTIDLVVTADPASPALTLSAEDPVELANDYALNQKALQNTEIDAVRDVLQGRLESLSRRIRDVVQHMDAGEIDSLLQKVGVDSAVGHEIKTIRTFNELQK